MSLLNFRALLSSFVLALSATIAGAAVGTLASPALSQTAGGIAVDEDENVYSADFGGTTVVKITPAGAVSVFLTGLNTPSGNAFDSKGAFYQSNYRDQANPGAPDRITRVSPKGQVSTFADSLNGPVGIAIDSNDTLFVVECDANRVSRIAQGGDPEVFVNGSLFNCPNGITFDEGGNLFVVNFSDGRVIKIKPDGEASVFVTVPGGGNGHLAYVAGKLYISARLVHQIYEVNVKKRKLKLLAGTGAAGQVDGPELQAQFNSPNAVERNRAGSAIFTNGRNNVVRQIDLNLPRPKPAKKVKAEALSSRELLLTWKHRSLNREGFIVEMATPNSDFEEVDRIGPSETSAAVKRLVPGSTYMVRIRTYNGTGTAKASKTATVDLPQ